MVQHEPKINWQETDMLHLQTLDNILLTFYGVHLNYAHEDSVRMSSTCFQLMLPASGASLRQVSQIRGDLEVATASKPEEVGWKWTSSSLPWCGCRVSSGLLGCSFSGSHNRHSFTCTYEEQTWRCYLLFYFSSLNLLPTDKKQFPHMGFSVFLFLISCFELFFWCVPGPSPVHRDKVVQKLCMFLNMIPHKLFNNVGSGLRFGFSSWCWLNGRMSAGTRLKQKWKCFADAGHWKSLQCVCVCGCMCLHKSVR